MIAGVTIVTVAYVKHIFNSADAASIPLWHTGMPYMYSGEIMGKTCLSHIFMWLHCNVEVVWKSSVI